MDECLFVCIKGSSRVDERLIASILLFICSRFLDTEESLNTVADVKGAMLAGRE
jgi:hypothetical protein